MGARLTLCAALPAALLALLPAAVAAGALGRTEWARG
jgi:hypothetical protein